MVSAAPIDTTPVRHTTAPKITSSTPTEATEVVSAQGSGYSGKGTWFTDSTGSCGTSFDTNDMIVAMNEAQMGGTSMCGKSVRITSGGKSVTARVTDTCPSQYCNSGSLDLSQAVFSKLAPLSTGVISITWEFA
ncbi:hypothetical protein K457DRAFT_64700 [Linnemannia elongata AG-77]|uniref:RlpA-like protein double-psi beta-barrel domain-containing protein n=1 Tax=Linnemannia elongata AG-77 TaxID=1314771 RepID=A0A197KG66_9FUNG|nr:hypothetical protein K457DRAFT_64700 [Linnemannia elongata AG-77]